MQQVIGPSTVDQARARSKNLFSMSVSRWGKKELLFARWGIADSLDRSIRGWTSGPRGEDGEEREGRSRSELGGEQSVVSLV